MAAPAEPPELWTCDRCELIGSPAQALRHEEETGHDIRRLSDEEAEGVRGVWSDEGRSPIDGGSGLGIVGVLLTEEGKRLARAVAGGIRSFRRGGLDEDDF